MNKQSTPTPPLQKIYFSYLLSLPMLGLWGAEIHFQIHENDSMWEVITPMLIFFGGLVGIVFYAVITEIITLPENPWAAWLMILDAPIQLLIFKLLGSKMHPLEFFTIDFLIEALGFVLALVVIVFYPQLNKNRIDPSSLTLSKKFVLLVLAGLTAGLYAFPFGIVAWNVLAAETWANRLPVITALLTTVWMYLGYMGAGYSRDNTVLILAQLGLWFLGLATAYGVGQLLL